MKNSHGCMLSVLAVLAVFGVFFFGNSQAAENSPEAGVVNVNTATEAQLQMLPGIGPSKARAIVEYRTKNQFVRVDDLAQVKGIGPKLLGKLRPHVTTDGPTTLKASLKNGRKRSK